MNRAAEIRILFPPLSFPVQKRRKARQHDQPRRKAERVSGPSEKEQKHRPRGCRRDTRRPGVGLFYHIVKDRACIDLNVKFYLHGQPRLSFFRRGPF